LDSGIVGLCPASREPREGVAAAAPIRLTSRMEN
jgi:hypothetical protein